MKTNNKLSAMAVAIGMSLSSGAQAGWWSDVTDWVETAAEDTVEWIDDTIIDPIEDTVSDVGDYLEYIDVVEATMSSTGYRNSGGLSYSEPNANAAATGTLNVATYNIHGFPEVLNGISNVQAQIVGAEIEGWAFDIVGIQEDWVVDEALRTNVTTNTYPYRMDHYTGTLLTYGDGLATWSKYPFDKNVSERSKWSQCNGELIEFIKGEINSPDCATEKGFSFSEVHVANDMIVHFYNLHANTGKDESNNRSDLTDISNWMSSYSYGYPVIVVGDFNMNWNGQADLLQEFIDNTGLRFTCQDSDDCGGKIDLIAYRGNDQFSFTTLTETNHDDGGISDHSPRSALLQWTNSGAEAGTLETSLSFSLRSAHGKYFVSEGNGGKTVNANRSGIGSWETLNLNAVTEVQNCILDGAEVNITTNDGYLWSAQSNGNLDSDRTNLGSWEKFTLINHSDKSGCLQQGDSISLLGAHHKYVVAEKDGKANANRSAVGGWEKMTVVLH